MIEMVMDGPIARNELAVPTHIELLQDQLMIVALIEDEKQQETKNVEKPEEKEEEVQRRDLHYQRHQVLIVLW